VSTVVSRLCIRAFKSSIMQSFMSLSCANFVTMLIKYCQFSGVMGGVFAFGWIPFGEHLRI